MRRRGDDHDTARDREPRDRGAAQRRGCGDRPGRSACGTRIDGVLIDAGLDTPIREIARATGLQVIDVRSGEHGDPAGFVALDLPPPSDDAPAALRARTMSRSFSARRARPGRPDSSPSPSPHDLALRIDGSAPRAHRQRPVLQSEPVVPVQRDFQCIDRTLRRRMRRPPGPARAVRPRRVCRQPAGLRPTWYVASYNFNIGLYRSLKADASPVAGHHLRFIRATSGRLDPQVTAGLETIFGVPVIEAYSSTESGRICGNPLPPKRRKHGTVGPPTSAAMSRSSMTTEIPWQPATGER